MILFRILGLFFLVWLFQRVLSFILGASKTKRAKNVPKGASSQMVKDPVCGMYMDPRLAVRLDRKSEEFYFCSEVCKQKYLNDPSGSAATGASAPR